MGFFLKKLVAFFLKPLGGLFLFFLLTIYFIRQNKKNKALFFATLAISTLFFLSYPPTVNLLVTPLESTYPLYTYDANITYIHVLGNGNNDDLRQPASSRLSDVALKRVIEGVVIAKKQPNTKLIFTGYAGTSTLSSAKANATLANLLGIENKRIITSSKPKDTYEEALFCKSIVGNKPFVLVTSAVHMPRAMKIFTSLGLCPIAAPCDFKKENITTLLRQPRILYLKNANEAIHEYLGLLWVWLKS